MSTLPNKLKPACGRIMVGSGTDTYDPLCELPAGHGGSCKSTAAVDQHRLPQTVEQIGKARRSKCHSATVHAEDGEPDFLGPTSYPRMVTCWFVCDECGEACDTVEVDG